MPAAPFQTIFAAVVLVGCTSPLPPQAAPSSGAGDINSKPTFYDAEAGDSVVIDFQSSGCFHHDDHSTKIPVRVFMLIF